MIIEDSVSRVNEALLFESVVSLSDGMDSVANHKQAEESDGGKQAEQAGNCHRAIFNRQHWVSVD